MDQPNFHPSEHVRPMSRLNVALTRIVAQGGLLAGIFGVFAGLILFDGLSLGAAALGYLAVVIAVALLSGGVMVTVAQPAEILMPLLPVPDNSVATFADALTDPCIVLDRRASVVHANTPARRQFPALSTGNPLTFSMRNPELVQAIEIANRTGVSRSIELHETIPSETWEKVVVAPLLRPGLDWFDDEDRQLIVTFQSLTELKRVEALRSDFIANASHELRTPLASLLGFIDTLLGPAARTRWRAKNSSASCAARPSG